MEGKNSVFGYSPFKELCAEIKRRIKAGLLRQKGFGEG